LTPPLETDLLTRMQDGPTLLELTRMIRRELGESPSRSVEMVLASLQDKGFAFVEEGRWWRTPEGVNYLEEVSAGEEGRQVRLKRLGVETGLLRVMSFAMHGVHLADVLAILAAGVFFMRLAVFAVGSSTFGGDIEIFFTFQNLVLRNAVMGFREIPLWNPYDFSGRPYLANPQTSPLYFSTPLILLLGEVDGIRWSVILHVVLSGLSMYYLMLSLEQKRSTSLFSALGYMFSGYVVARVAIGHLAFVYGYAWAPLAFALWWKATATGRIRYAMIAGLVLAFQLQSGAVILLAYTLLLLAFHFAYCCLRFYWTNRKSTSGFHQHSGSNRPPFSRMELIACPVRRYGPVALVTALAFLSLSAVKVLPMIEFMSQTSRIAESGGIQGGLPTIQAVFLALLERNAKSYHYLYGFGWWEYCAYMGWLVFPAIAAVFLSRRSSTVFFLFIAIFSITLAMGTYSPLSVLIEYLYDRVPVLSSVLHLPARALFLTVFSISILSGIGISSVFKKITKLARKNSERLVSILVCLALIVTVLDLGSLGASDFRTFNAPTTPPFTSLAPNDMSICWIEYPVSIVTKPGEPIGIHIRARNAGDTIWLKESSQRIPLWNERQDKGTVNLAVFLGEARYKYPLPKDISPGEEMDLTVNVPAPRELAQYSFVINLAVELVGSLDPPYPVGNLTVRMIDKPVIVTSQMPLYSYSRYHALEWISKQCQGSYFRIGPFTTGDVNLHETLRLGLFEVGGLDSKGTFLTRYVKLASNPSYKCLGLFNVRYLVVDQRSYSNDLKLVYNATPWLVYENTHCLPRAFCIERAILIIGRDSEVMEIQNHLIDADYYDLTKIGIVRGESFRAQEYDSEFLKRFELVALLPWGVASDESKLTEKCKQAGVPLVASLDRLEQYLQKPGLPTKSGFRASGEIAEFSLNKVVVKAKSDAPGFLILSEVMYPGWKAQVDGKEVPILSAYSVLRSVFLSTPGEHEISFTYEPGTFVMGSYVTYIALLVMVIVVTKEKLKSFSLGKRGARAL